MSKDKTSKNKLNQSDKSTPQKPLPPEELQRLLHLEAHYSSPIPPAKELENYEKIVPGSAKMFLEIFYSEVNHRRKLEEKVLGSGIKTSDKGQNFGFIIAILGLIAGTICILQGHETGGSVIGGIPLVSLVSVFVYGKYKEVKQKKAENEEE